MKLIKNNREPKKKYDYHGDDDTLKVKLPVDLAIENQRLYKGMSITESTIETLINKCRGAKDDKEIK